MEIKITSDIDGVKYAYTKKYDGRTRDTALIRFASACLFSNENDGCITANGLHKSDYQTRPRDSMGQPDTAWTQPRWRAEEFCRRLKSAVNDGRFVPQGGADCELVVIDNLAPAVNEPNGGESSGASGGGRVAPRGTTLALLLAASLSMLLVPGCMSTGTTTAANVETNGAMADGVTILDDDTSTLRTPDGAPNFSGTPKIRTQSSVARSELAIVLPDGRELHLASGSDGFSIGSATYTEEGGDTSYTFEISDLSSSGRATVIGADNEGAAIWAGLLEAMSDDQRAVYEEALGAGNSVFDALSLALGGG